MTSSFTRVDLRSKFLDVRPSFALGSIFVIVLAGLSPLLIVAATPDPQTSGWGGPAVIMIGSGIAFAVLIARGERALFALSIWLFVYVFLGAAPLIQLRTGLIPATTPYVDADYYWPTFWVVAIGMSSFVAGGLLAPRAKPHLLLRPNVSASRTYALGTLGLLFAAFYMVRIGFGSVFSSRDSRQRAVTAAFPDLSAQAIVTAAATMLLLVGFVAAVVLIRQLKQASKSTFHATVFASVMALVLLVIVNPLSTPRYVSGTALLGMFTATGLVATKKRFRIVAVLAIAALVFVFPLADAFRTDNVGFKTTANPLEALTSPDFDSWNQITNTIYCVDRDGLQIGSQAAGVVLFWLPRSVWPEKPQDTGVFVAKCMDYSFQNLSAPLWAELYINGAWVGVVLGMGLVGYLTRLQDRRIARQFDLAGFTGPIWNILPFYAIILLRGSLLQAMAWLAVILIACLFVARKSSSIESNRVL